MKKVSFHTLGCKLNFSETSTIARQFEQGGFERVPARVRADICVVNTCSVTDHADKKCRNVIRRIVRNNPGAIVAVTGCYAQLRPDEIAAIDGVDIVAGNGGKSSLYERVTALSGKGGVSVYACDASELTSFFSAFSAGDRTRAFLKVQDGCDYHCSYCTIPAARGASRNILIAQLVEQAELIAASGRREIVITGINTGDFGRTTGERFVDLLAALYAVQGIERYRISSIEPNLITDSVIELVAKHGTPHFHIPLQSGCDRILGLMRRRYNTSLFAQRIEAVREAMPDAFIGIDVIVGFPGESVSDFDRTVRFLETIRPSFLHVFPYSPRPGTPAVELEGRVSPAEASRRVKVLTELSGRLHRDFAQRFVGTVADVLFEMTEKGGLMTGFTPNYIKVAVPYDRSCRNTIKSVQLTSVEPDGTVIGHIAE